jgi:hypothetical protein
MNKSNSKADGPAKQIWIPLSAQSFFVVSSMVTTSFGVLGFKLGAKMFPKAPIEFQTGDLAGSSLGLVVIVILAALVANIGFGRIYKLGRSNNG